MTRKNKVCMETTILGKLHSIGQQQCNFFPNTFDPHKVISMNSEGGLYAGAKFLK